MVRPFSEGRLSVHNSVYDFERLPHPDQDRPMPDDVRNELLVSLALAPFWSANLDRPFRPLISATDASTRFGFWVCVADASMDVVRRVAGLAEKRG